VVESRPFFRLALSAAVRMPPLSAMPERTLSLVAAPLRAVSDASTAFWIEESDVRSLAPCVPQAPTPSAAPTTTASADNVDLMRVMLPPDCECAARPATCSAEAQESGTRGEKTAVEVG
jgi:hypothetical protein